MQEALAKDRWDKREDESYEQHAQRIADAVGLRVEVKQGAPKCPAWGDSAGMTHCPYGKCRGHHGKHWRIALHAKSGNSHVLSFWQSVNDDMRAGHRPTVYDVLACLDWYGPTDPDEVASEYGPMKPSQAIAIAEQNKALHALLMYPIPHSWALDALGHIA